MKKRSKSLPTLKLLLLLLTLSTTACSSPLMIEQKEQFLQKLRTKNIAVLFYGDNQSPEYQSFEQIIPSSSQLFDGMEFVYVPASKFKLNRPNPSLSIYRKIGGGDWQLYKGNFDRVDMDKWIQHNIMDPLKELTVENLEKMFRDGEPSFILLGYGEFQLIRTKVYVGEFCHFKQIKCWKVEPASPIYSVVAKLMGIQKHDFGESKLAFYNPQSERLQLYTKDIWKLKRQQLLQMYEGRQGIIHSQSPEGEIQIELHYQEDSQEI